MAEDKALDTKKDGALAIPARRGFEEPSQQEDFIIPRAKLLQALSPEVVAEPDKFKPGMVINSLTLEVLPEVFIPIFKFTNWIRFNPRNTKDQNYDPAYGPGDIMWRSKDPLDPRVITESKFGEDGSNPLATKFLNFFSMFPGVDMPVIVSFSKTSFKAGKRLLSLAQFATKDGKPIDMFEKKYKLSVKQEVNDAKQVYFVLAVDPDVFVDDDSYEKAIALWERFHAKPIQIHEEVVDEVGEEVK